MCSWLITNNIWFENATLTKDEIATRTQIFMLEAASRMQTLKRN